MPPKAEGCEVIVRIQPDGTVLDVAGIRLYAKAVELPPHGDLIDAQEQMRLMQVCEYDTYDDYSRAFDMLDNAPTIIEAEAGESV